MKRIKVRKIPGSNGVHTGKITDTDNPNSNGRKFTISKLPGRPNIFVGEYDDGIYTSANAPTAQDYGVGSLWIDGQQYWSDGVSLSLAAPERYYTIYDSAQDTDITVELQAALQPNTVVRIQSGIYIISDTIVVPSYSSLILDENTTLKCNMDKPMLLCSGRSYVISGGKFKNNSTVLSKTTPLIHVKPAIGVNIQRNDFISVIEKTFISRPYAADAASASGIGLLLEANSAGTNQNYINYFRANNINFGYLDCGIELRCNEDSGGGAFINGNVFDCMFFERCVDFIKLNTSGAGTPAISCNYFTNFQIQSQAWSNSGISCNGVSSRNVFNGTIWDWSVVGNAKAIVVASTALYNDFKVKNVTVNNVTMDFSSNYLENNNYIYRKLPTVANVSELPNPAQHNNRLFYVDHFGIDNKLVYSNGLQWVPLHNGRKIEIVENASKDFIQKECVDGLLYKLDATADVGAILFSSVNTATNAIIANNTFIVGDVVRFKGAALPTGLSANVNYWVISATATEFTVSASKGGAAVNITATGSGSILPCPIYNLDAVYVGAVVHIFNASPDRSLIIRPSSVRRFYDNYAGTVSTAGAGIILNPQYREVKLECGEGNNWHIILKRSFTGVYE